MRQLFTPEQHIELLIEGLQKLQAKIAAGESVRWVVDMPEGVEEKTPTCQQDKETRNLLQVEGGYTPGKYALADRLVADIARSRLDQLPD